MPYPISNISKRDVRGDVATVLEDNLPLETTSAGGAAGATAVFSSLIDEPRTSIVNRYLVMEEGTDDSNLRVVKEFAGATGTITPRRAFSAQIATAMSAHLHEFDPRLYTTGVNEAIRELSRAVYRPILQHSFTRSGLQRSLPMPRNAERIMRLMEDGYSSEAVRDYFDRTASATDPGSKWTASSGTWGITAESLYSPGDTDADLLLAAATPDCKNGVIQAVLRGDTTDTASRVLSLVFRYEDTSNYLYVRLLNGQVDLRKHDAGSGSSLATGTLTTTENVDYVVRVMFDGSWVDVWVDDVQYIHYELLGLNLKYLGYDESGTGTFGNVGFRLDKTGAPSLAATATLARDYFCHHIVRRVGRPDWKPQGSRIDLFSLNRGWRLSEGRMLWLEGVAPLTQLAADTTFETLASDSTARLEIQTSDPAYEVLVEYAAAYVLRGTSRMTADAEKRAEYRQRSIEQMAHAQDVRRRKAMRYYQRAFV